MNSFGVTLKRDLILDDMFIPSIYNMTVGSQSNYYFKKMTILSHFTVIKGHSRTIVGIEEGTKSRSLLIFDPSTRKATIEQNRTNPNKLLNLFRKNLSMFDKKQEYQLLVIRGPIVSNDEYIVIFL